SLPLTLTLPPPVSTLLPYTTLFRSLDEGVDHRPAPDEGLALVDKEPDRHHLQAVRLDRDDAVLEHPGAPARAQHQWDVREPHHPDRKSTRLNSSHVSISYAVFCLKK